MGSHSNIDAPRALITGIAGFTGRYLAKELEDAGYQVLGLSHEEAQGSPNIFTCDLEDKSHLADIVEQIRPDFVAHLAAVSFVAHDDVDEIYRINLLGTRNLLAALDKASIHPKKVLLASSANIYGNAPVIPITEELPPSPVNDYAVSKLAMEEIAKLWFDRLPIIITRPFNYTGVGQPRHFLIPKIVEHFRSGKKVIELGNINVERDFSDVRDVVKIYRLLLENAEPGKILNICSGVSISLKEIIRALERLARYNINVDVNPDFVRPNEIQRLVGSNEKLFKTIGRQNMIPIEETLGWMYKRQR